MKLKIFDLSCFVAAHAAHTSFLGAEMRLLRPGMGTQYQEMESIPAKDMIPNQSRNAANIKKHIPPKTGFRGLFSVIQSGRVGS